MKLNGKSTLGVRNRGKWCMFFHFLFQLKSSFNKKRLTTSDKAVNVVIEGELCLKRILAQLPLLPSDNIFPMTHNLG